MKPDVILRSRKKSKKVVDNFPLTQKEMRAAIERGKKENVERNARIEEKTKKQSINNFVENPVCGFRSQASVILSQKNLSLPPKVMDSVVERELKNCSR
jgi:hypothetical protein